MLKQNKRVCNASTELGIKAIEALDSNLHTALKNGDSKLCVGNSNIVSLCQQQQLQQKQSTNSIYSQFGQNKIFFQILGPAMSKINSEWWLDNL